jgi:LuxR family maltose regulon positive regulatory protein
MEANNWHDEYLRVMILHSVAHHAKGETDKAVDMLEKALTLAKPGGFIRLFLDEGAPIKNLLSIAATRGIMPHYVARLLAAFESGLLESERPQRQVSCQHLVEPLSERELEILQLLAQGLSNREIGERLFLAIPTVKGYNRNIFAKLQVRRRTEAVAHAREIGVL